MSVERFHHDESRYATWLEENPSGFVFNHFRGSDGYMNIVHRASCSFLRRSRDERRRTRYEKICSKDLERLTAFVDQLRADAGGWKRCGRCCPS